MRTLVVYYSRTGNTRKIAEEVAAALRADTEELKDPKYCKGVVGWLRSGRDATKRLPADLKPLTHDPGAYDLVVVGTPVWGGTICPPIRTFMAQQRSRLKKAAWFCTCRAEDGSSAAKAFPEMTEESGTTPVGTLSLGPETVKGDHSLALNKFVSQVAARSSS